MKIGDHDIDSQGNVKVLEDLRLSAQYLVPKLAHNDHVHMTILRDKKTMEVEVPVVTHFDYVMPPLVTKYPRYFVFGPMVFTQVTQDLATRMSAAQVVYTSYYRSPLVPRLLDPPAFTGEEIVALTLLLPHKTSKGYAPPPVSVVTKVNGTAVKNLSTWWNYFAMPRENF